MHLILQATNLVTAKMALSVMDTSVWQWISDIALKKNGLPQTAEETIIALNPSSRLFSRWLFLAVLFLIDSIIIDSPYVS
jgi:hypothetical protein